MLRISPYACSNETPSRSRAMRVRSAAAAHRAQLLQRQAVRDQEVGFLADDGEARRASRR